MPFSHEKLAIIGDPTPDTTQPSKDDDVKIIYYDLRDTTKGDELDDALQKWLFPPAKDDDEKDD